MNHNRWSSFSSHLISLDLIEFPHRTASGHAQPPLTNWTGDLRLGEYRSNPFPSPTFPHYFYTPFHPFPCILHFSSMPLLRCYLLRKLLFRTQTHTADRLHYLATKMNGKIRESKSIKSTDCSICPYIVKEFATYGTQPLKVQGGRDRRGRPDRQPSPSVHTVYILERCGRTEVGRRESRGRDGIRYANRTRPRTRAGEI